MQELKNELASIIVSQTLSGVKEKFGLPKRATNLGEQKIAEWKDRYSALLMADFEASEITKPAPNYVYQFHGGSLEQIANKFGVGHKPSIRVRNETGEIGNQVYW